MQAANVRRVGELFGSVAQMTRIERLEAEVRDLKDLVKGLKRKNVGLWESTPGTDLGGVDNSRMRTGNDTRCALGPLATVSRR